MYVNNHCCKQLLVVQLYQYFGITKKFNNVIMCNSPEETANSQLPLVLKIKYIFNNI